MNIARMLIGGAGSGSGKTTITCALLQILSDQNKRTAAFKCGPDYIDPMFHRKVLGIPSKNLDTFFTGELVTRSLFEQGMTGMDVAVIEGVMGLYDGLGGIKEEASSYHLAKILKTPIVLVIDGHGMGRSLLALIAGFLSYDTGRLIKGIILNRIGKSFYETIKPEIEANLPVHVLGYFPNMKEIHVESRHLGLKLPEELADIRAKIKKAADVLKETLDIPLLFQLAEQAPEWKWSGEAEETARNMIPLQHSFLGQDGIVRQDKIPIGIAMDEAFCFYYEDNLRLLEEMGAEPVPFSPLRDQELPKGIQGMILGGGYPELYAEGLSRNVSMLQSVAEAIARGMPSIAECGGFLYLHERMKTEESVSFPMAGVIAGTCFLTDKPVRFGYVEIQEEEPLFLKTDGRIRGHEFHYFDSTNNGRDCRALKPVSGITYPCIHQTENNWWGFVHLYYYSNPQYAVHFMEKAAAYGRKENG